MTNMTNQLHIAVQNGDVELVQTLLDARHDPPEKILTD